MPLPVNRDPVHEESRSGKEPHLEAEPISVTAEPEGSYLKPVHNSNSLPSSRCPKGPNCGVIATPIVDRDLES